MSFYKHDYERLSESLQTSEEFLYAIEKVAGESFECDEDGKIIDNNAGLLWKDNGCRDEILDALPLDNINNGDEIYWADLSAWFNGVKWRWIN